jgi:hypothetical protein
VGRAGADVRPVRDPGQADLVGVLVGYHGARHVLRHVRHRHGGVRLLRAHAGGDDPFEMRERAVSTNILLQEYILNDVRDRQHLLLLHKKAKKTGFDVNQYNVLKDQIAKVELDLRRLRDPLKLKLPPKAKEETKTEPVEKTKE